VTEAGPIEAPVTDPFHEFGQLFAPGLIPLAVLGERRRVDAKLPRKSVNPERAAVESKFQPGRCASSKWRKTD
jgi:hypothetical protein